MTQGKPLSQSTAEWESQGLKFDPGLLRSRKKKGARSTSSKKKGGENERLGHRNSKKENLRGKEEEFPEGVAKKSPEDVHRETILRKRRTLLKNSSCRRTERGGGEVGHQKLRSTCETAPKERKGYGRSGCEPGDKLSHLISQNGEERGNVKGKSEKGAASEAMYVIQRKIHV